MLKFAAARDVPSSPSGCASRCIAEGLKPRGIETLQPKSSWEMSMLSTLTRIRGLIL